MDGSIPQVNHHGQSREAQAQIISYTGTLIGFNTNPLTDPPELPIEFHHMGNYTSKMC